MIILCGCVEELKVRKMPGVDFSTYHRAAILPVRMTGVEGIDKVNAAEHSVYLTAILTNLAQQAGVPIIPWKEVSEKLKAAGLKMDQPRLKEWLSKAGNAAGATCFLTADVSYYGEFTYRVPPARYPVIYRDWWGYPYRGIRWYYYEPGYLETGTRAALKVILYDAETGDIIWSASGVDSGNESDPAKYARNIIKEALKKFPLRVK